MDGRQHKVTSKRRFYGDFRGLEVTNLPDHDDVWILPQERTQRRREVEAYILVHNDLVDASEVEFNRVFRSRVLNPKWIQVGS